MFRRFIVATDVSAASFSVVRCLAGLRDYGAEQCLLLACLDKQEAMSVGLSYSTESLERIVQQQKETLEKQGFEVEERIVPGYASREINHIADKEDYSLIVVGSQGQSAVREVLLGGVAYNVIHHAIRPVLLIKLEAKQKDGSECLEAARCDFSEHVLFPTDFSENADHAFTYVEKLAADGARRVTLLHVQDRVRIEPHLSHRLDEFNGIDRNRLEALRETLRRKSNAEVDVELRYGSPFEEIIRIARERNAHLIVMGSQGRGFVKELFLGSVSHSVARHSGAAVLLIPGLR